MSGWNPIRIMYSTVCPSLVEIHLAQKPDIYRCICSNRDRLGLYSKIQNIFGSVWCQRVHFGDSVMTRAPIPLPIFNSELLMSRLKCLSGYICSFKMSLACQKGAITSKLFLLLLVHFITQQSRYKKHTFYIRNTINKISFWNVFPAPRLLFCKD